jgi:transcriptional regulator with XRE-family HTH domain
MTMSGKAIIGVLKQYGYSQKNISEHIKVPGPTISQISTGKIQPSVPTQSKLEWMLKEHEINDISPDDFKTERAVREHVDVFEDLIARQCETYSKYGPVERFILLMQMLKVPQADLADKLGVPAQYLSSYLSGRILVKDRIYVAVYELLDSVFPDDIPTEIKIVVQEIKAMYG